MCCCQCCTAVSTFHAFFLLLISTLPCSAIHFGDFSNFYSTNPLHLLIFMQILGLCLSLFFFSFLFLMFLSISFSSSLPLFPFFSRSPFFLSALSLLVLVCFRLLILLPISILIFLASLFYNVVTDNGFSSLIQLLVLTLELLHIPPFIL